MNNEPEHGPEWDGPDRGTNSRGGCLVTIAVMLFVVVLITLILR